MRNKLAKIALMLGGVPNILIKPSANSINKISYKIVGSLYKNKVITGKKAGKYLNLIINILLVIATIIIICKKSIISILF